MLRVVITGGIACGKSLAASFISAAGVPVCETDDVAHELMAPGTDVFRGVVDAFGAEILDPNGAIDRQRLGKRVFADTDQLARLGDLVHPPVLAAVRDWLAQCESELHRAAAVVIPLLYEAGWHSGWDAVVCVTVPDGIQLDRLRARGLSMDDAIQRVVAQMPTTEKVTRADYVIVNSGTKASLQEQTLRVWRSIVEK